MQSAIFLVGYVFNYINRCNNYFVLFCCVLYLFFAFYIFVFILYILWFCFLFFVFGILCFVFENS